MISDSKNNSQLNTSELQALNLLREIAKKSTKAAIEEAFQLIMKAAAQSGFVQGGKTTRINAPLFIDFLIKDGFLAPECANKIDQLARLHTQPEEYQASSKTPKDIDDYLVCAVKISAYSKYRDKALSRKP